jgi:hypothetical protein
MTLQIKLLDVRLAQAVVKAQQAIAAGPAAGDNKRLAFDLPHGLMADVRRMLRQFGPLRHERATIESALAAAPAEQRPQEQLRLRSFDADLARVLGRAARLAFLLLVLRRHAGEAAGIDAAPRVQYLGTVFGQSLDAALVRHTVQQIAARPMGAANGVGTGALADALFIALALVTALAPCRGASA